ncbi:putative ribonuclease H-like domain-containing protein [Tanacetum coccineum]
MTAKSRTVNTSYIDATVAGKPVTISEASIRSDLLFDDADGIDSFNNQAIFDNIQLMGYEGDLNTLTCNKALFSPQWKFDVIDKKDNLRCQKMNKSCMMNLRRWLLRLTLAKAMDDVSRQALKRKEVELGHLKRSSTEYKKNNLLLASTLPNAGFTIDPKLPDWQDAFDTLANDGILMELMMKMKILHSEQNIQNHKDHRTVSLHVILSLRRTQDDITTLQDESWVEAMQEELLQFKLQKVWVAIWKKDYDEVFAPVARIEAIRLFLAFASYMGFTVYQMDVKSAFLYDTIEEEMSSMGELTFFLGLQVKQQPDGIFISQDKSMDLVSLIFQVTPKASHLNAVKRIFRYLKHQPKLGLWYPRDSPFELEAYSDSDYGGASLDRKSTTGGCQFLRKRLISWQCKKQTIMANSTTEAEYVAAANCCGQVLWIQNQMMDYGFNFMNTKIHIDNESTISVIKNPVAHSRTNHIEIRFHFIRYCYEKRLIEHWLIESVTTIEERQDDFVYSLYRMLCEQTDFANGDVFISLGSRESLERDMDGTEEFLLSNLFDFWLTKVSTDMLKHNMVAYLEKTDGNTEFHQIMDFLTRSSIYYALTVSPIVSTSFVEQFWTTAKSRTVNNISYIDATVAGKPVTISEASIRSDLLFDDADGIDSLNNQAIFDNIQLMGSKSTSWDQIPSNIATAGKNFSGKVTPLFDFMLVQQTEDEGDTSERPSDSQPIPSPPHPSADQPQTQINPSPRPYPSIVVPDSILKGSGRNHGGQSSNDASLSGNEDGLTL